MNASKAQPHGLAGVRFSRPDRLRNLVEVFNSRTDPRFSPAAVDRLPCRE